MSIKLVSYTKSYKNKELFKLLDLEIYRGDRLAIIGNNGSGKTTLINSICNLNSFKGHLFVGGKAIGMNSHSYKKDFGIFLSTPYFFPKMTITEYWTFSANLLGVNTKESAFMEKIDTIRHTFCLNNLDLKIEKLSSGDKIKTSLGICFLHNPNYLIFDEPFVHLDNKSREILLTILSKLSDNKTLILASHNLDVCSQICNRFIIIKNGKIIKDFNRSDFKSHSLKDYLRQNLIDTIDIKKFEEMYDYLQLAIR